MIQERDTAKEITYRLIRENKNPKPTNEEYSEAMDDMNKETQATIEEYLIKEVNSRKSVVNVILL